MSEGKKKRSRESRGVNYSKWLREDDARMEAEREAEKAAMKKRLEERDRAYAAAFPELAKRKVENRRRRVKDEYQEFMRRFW